MDAVVLAGGTPAPNDPLYPYAQGRPKVLIDIAGKPMLQWVLEALDAVADIDAIVIVGLTESHGLQSAKVRAYLPDQGGMLANILAGLREVLRRHPQAEYAALLAGDIPAITPEMVHWMVAQIDPDEPFDIAYTVIRREVMEARFPEARRTYARLKDITACGGDFHFVRPTLVNTLVGIRSVDRDLRDLMRSLNASRWQTLTMLEIPASMPVLLGGFKVSVTLAVIGAVVGEFIGADRGLGFLINVAKGTLDTPLLFVVIFTLVVIALLMYLSVVLLERMLLRWQKAK